MNMILSILILSLSLVTGLPVEEVQLMATIDSNEVHNREVRSLTYRLGWHLDRIDQRSPLLDGKYCPINQGSGVDIYVISTGIEYKNEEFGGRAFYGGYDKHGYDGSDKAGQGTAVASLAVGKTVGVAKKAKVYSIRVPKYKFFAKRFSAVIEGMEHVINRVKFTQKRSVIALPFQVYGHHPDINAVVKKAVDAGIVVVTGSGIDPCRDSPADSPDAIVVGTTNRNDSIFYRLFYGRNYEDCVTLFAPGLYIRSATISKRCFPATECYLGGLDDTKKACGIVAGAAALLLERYPHYTPQEVKQHLIKEATDIDGGNKLLYIEHDRAGCVDNKIEPGSGFGEMSDDEDL